MKAQTYTLDLVLALVLVTLVATLLISFDFSPAQPPQTRTDAKSLGEALHNPYPAGWNDTTVVIPGIAQNHRLNTTLLDRFENLTEDRVRGLVGMKSRFHLNVTSDGTLVGSHGTAPPADAEDVHAIQRYAAHNGTLAQLEVVAWLE